MFMRASNLIVIASGAVTAVLMLSFATTSIVRAAQASLPPGNVNDAPYRFEYRSSFDSTTHLYSRSIQNNSGQEVRFHWPQTDLGGRAPAGLRLSHSGPIAPDPKIAPGEIFYDYRSTRVTAYSMASSSPLSKIPGLQQLLSVFEAYVEDPQGKLRPAALKIASEHRDQMYSYSVSNNSEVAVRVSIPDLSRGWLETSAAATYRNQFAALVKEQIVAGQADQPAFVLNAGKTAVFNLMTELSPRLVVGRMEIMGATRGAPDAYCAVTLYLPTPVRTIT
jgi:hypothetical protein